MDSVPGLCRSVKVQTDTFTRSSVKIRGSATFDAPRCAAGECGAERTTQESRRADLIAAVRAEHPLPNLDLWPAVDPMRDRLRTLPRSARKVLCALLLFVDKFSIAGPSQERIAKHIGSCERTVIRAIKLLVESGAVVVVYDRSRPTRTIAVYRLHPALTCAYRAQRAARLQRLRAARSWNSRRRDVTQTSSSSFVGRRDRETKHFASSNARACRAEQKRQHESAVAALVARLNELAVGYGPAGPALCPERASRLIRRHGVAAVARRLDQAIRRPAWLRREVESPAAYLVACCARELPPPPSAERIFADERERERRRAYAIGLQREAEHAERKRQAAIAARSFTRTAARTRVAPADDFVQKLNRLYAAARERLARDPWLVDQIASVNQISSDMDGFFSAVCAVFVTQLLKQERALT